MEAEDSKPKQSKKPAYYGLISQQLAIVHVCTSEPGWPSLSKRRAKFYFWSLLCS